jgi:hypothetical protein
VNFPITFEHLGRQFTLSIAPASGTMPLFPRDAGSAGAPGAEPVIVLEVADDPMRYACGQPERYRDADVLIARVSLWYNTLKPSGRPFTPPATRSAGRRP